MKYDTHINRIISMIINRMNNEGYICGIPLNSESPRLMTGLAGIGYGLLRKIELSSVASLLTLEPPK